MSDVDVVLIGALVLLALSLGLLVRGYVVRGWRRLMLSRGAAIASLLLLPLALYLGSRAASIELSVTLGVVGLVVTFIFGFLGSRASAGWSRIRVSVVIPSRVDFYKDIRRGLRRGLNDMPVEILDEYESIFSSIENVADFLPSLRVAADGRPDYFVLACPSVAIASSPEVVRIIEDLSGRGGASFFIENGPSPESLAPDARCYVVRFNSSRGAEILADFVSRHYAGFDVQLLVGPPNSDPAMQRRAVFEEHLPGAKVTIGDAAGWTRSACRAATEQVLEASSDQSVFVCGNDTMALGACDAILAVGRDDAFVVGFDGIRRALVAIAEPRNPFVATLRTPPAAYGQEIAGRIREMGRWRRVDAQVGCELTVDEGNLVTRHNVDQILEEIW